MFPDAQGQPTASLLKITYLIYALHIFSAVSGLLSPAFILTAFLTGWPSIIALVMSYVWRGDAQGSFLHSHFDWLIGTFWKALIWLVIAWLLILSVIGAIIGIPIMLLVGIWVLYRLGRGLFALNDRKHVP
jgi:uncharacterized membrane protein